MGEKRAKDEEQLQLQLGQEHEQKNETLRLEPNTGKLYLSLKRVMDIVVSFIGMIALSPVFWFYELVDRSSELEELLEKLKWMNCYSY